MSAVALENLRKDSEMRVQTDTYLSTAWILLPIIALLLVIVISVVTALAAISKIGSTTTPPTTSQLMPYAGGFGLATLVGIGSDILILYFFYMLIRRRNQHFPRQQRFFTDLVTVLRTAANRKSVNVDPTLGSIENAIRQAQTEETDKSAILWVVLMLIPLVNIIAILYVLYFLTKDYYKHERWEDGVLSDVERTLAPMGVQFIFHRNESVPDRSFILYLIITIVTLGLFGLYWMYILIKDPNNHFKNHAVYEPQLIQLLAPLAS
jgi:flagellar basal body-associated protein FliL